MRRAIFISSMILSLLKIFVMRKGGAVITLIFVLLVSCTPPAHYLVDNRLKKTASRNTIRVLIDKNRQGVTLSSRNEMRITVQETGETREVRGNREVLLTPHNVIKPVAIETWKTFLNVNGTPYRGSLEVHNLLGVLHVINIVEVDEYLLSVVPSEIPSGWPMEALKSQAVAARTYTYHHLMKNDRKNIYDLDSSRKFQVYKGASVETDSTTRAVTMTSGQIITYNDVPVVAYFHSTCGGRTIDDKYVWRGKDLPYLQGVKSEYCSESPHYRWETFLTIHEIEEALNKNGRRAGRIKKVTFKKHDGRVTSVTIEHAQGLIVLSGNDFRLLFPVKKLKSTFFTAKKMKNGLLIRGNGWGHGVGMCQWSAKGMAERGMNYKKILHYFYSDVKIRRLNPSLIARKP